MKKITFLLIALIPLSVFAQIDMDEFNRNNVLNFCNYHYWTYSLGDEYEADYFSDKAFDEVRMANDKLFEKLKSEGMPVNKINSIIESSLEMIEYSSCYETHIIQYNAGGYLPSKDYGKVIEISQKIYNEKLNVYSQVKNSNEAYPYKEVYISKTVHPAVTDGFVKNNDIFIYRILYMSSDNKFYQFKFLWDDNLNDLFISKVKAYFSESGVGDWDSESFFWINGWSDVSNDSPRKAAENSSDIDIVFAFSNEKQFVIEVNDFFKLFKKIFPQKEYDNYVKSRKKLSEKKEKFFNVIN